MVGVAPNQFVFEKVYWLFKLAALVPLGSRHDHIDRRGPTRAAQVAVIEVTESTV